MLNFDDEQNNKIKNWRIVIIYALVVLVFGYYVVRLFDLQIIERDAYVRQADDNRTKEISVQTERGVIYDRNGIVLARNVASYNITITPADLPGDPTEVPLPGAIEKI